MACTEEYLKLTEQWVKDRGSKIIVLYQNGSFFEIYALKDKKTGEITGSCIEDVCKICDLKIAQKNFSVQGKHALQAGFKIEVIDKYIKKMYESGYTIPVYEQKTYLNSEAGTKYKKELIEQYGLDAGEIKFNTMIKTQSEKFVRECTQVISPGTYWNNEQEALSNNTTCIWIYHSKSFGHSSEKIHIGLSNLDIFTGKSSIFEFSNVYQHDPSTYDELERYISINNPSEVLFVHNITNDQIEDIIKFCNINANSILKVDTTNIDDNNYKKAEKCEKQTYQSEIIKTYFPSIDDEIFFETYQNFPIATQAFCFLLDFVYTHNPNLINRISQPSFENCSERLVLANHSLNQLNIISDNRYKGKHSSVCEFLNNCVTNMGKRKFNYELLNPIKDASKLTKMYDITEHLLTKNTWEVYRNQLQLIKDIEKLTRKLIIKKITPKDISTLYNNINIVISLYNKIVKDKTLSKYMNQPAIEEDCQNINQLIEESFDVLKSENINEIAYDGLYSHSVEELMFIKKGKSVDVDNKIKEYFDSKDKFESIRSYLSGLIQPLEKKPSTEFIKIHETSKSEDCLLGTKRRLTFLKTQISKMTNTNIAINYKSRFTETNETFNLNLSLLEYKANGSSDNNQVVTSVEISLIAETIQNSKDEIVSEIIKFYNLFINDLIQKQETLNKICKYITTLDTLQCRCYIANKYNYCKPFIQSSDKAFVKFEGIRHCLIEHIQTREIYVTNDLSIGEKDNVNNANGYLLYGTNAVGKTSLIRSIGIAVLMAQAGLYVPCSKFTFSPYSYLFTRILGNDNLFKGQSTFAVEMSELRTILNMADKNSLILGDELCSGTEQGSATSIFGTGLEFLDRLNSSYIFATHFHEITSWPEIINIKNLKMMHMTVMFDRKTGKLVYDRKLKEGPGQNMYGLEVCKALRLPEEFLNRAHQIRMKYYPESANVTSFNGSHFNQKKIKGICEMCKINISEEVHHLQFQRNANETNKYINSFHKNHPANLMSLCEDCHNNFHSTDSEYRRVKTSEGYELTKIK